MPFYVANAKLTSFCLKGILQWKSIRMGKLPPFNSKVKNQKIRLEWILTFDIRRSKDADSQVKLIFNYLQSFTKGAQFMYKDRRY